MKKVMIAIGMGLFLLSCTNAKVLRAFHKQNNTVSGNNFFNLVMNRGHGVIFLTDIVG